jgi:uncharacterized protein (UPF0212 family)
MGTYNTLIAPLICPRCGAELEAAEVNCYFGNTSYMIELRIGDEYPWRGARAVHNGGRPAGGDIDGEGYVECPSCSKDFFVRVQVRADRITGLSPEPDRPGYID